MPPPPAACPRRAGRPARLDAAIRSSRSSSGVAVAEAQARLGEQAVARRTPSRTRPSRRPRWCPARAGRTAGRRSRIASRSATPHSGPRANRLSYSSRTPRPAGGRVDVLAADGAGGARRRARPAGRRSALRRRWRPPPRTCPAWKFRVGRALSRLNVSRLATVPSSRYFAVAGPNDLRDRSRAAATTRPGRRPAYAACRGRAPP